MPQYHESIDVAAIIHDGLVPMYENGQPYPNQRGFYLQHQPLTPEGRGDLNGVWRICLAVSWGKRGAGRGGFVPNWYRTAGHGDLDTMRKKLARIVAREGLTLVLRPRLEPDWTGALYATVDGEMHGEMHGEVPGER